MNLARLSIIKNAENKPNTRWRHMLRKQQEKLPKPKSVVIGKNSSYMYVCVCTTVAYNTAQNSCDNLPSPLLHTVY